MYYTLLLLMGLSVMIFVGIVVHIGQGRLRTCEDFSTQAKAQKAFQDNPEKYSRLDRDHDGIPCESLPPR